MAGRVLVVGEVLIDVVRPPSGEVTEHVGGSPANVAIGLARLGHDVDFATVVGDDERGRRCLAHLQAGGVDVTAQSRHAGATSVADATVDASGAATYAFDLRWDLAPVTVGDRTGHVHSGSIATTLEPGEREVTAAFRSARGRATVSYDPNVRPTIMGGADLVRARVEELLALSDVVKASDEDLAFLYPDRSVEEALEHWGALGPALVVVTRGPDGVVARTTATGEVAREPAGGGSVVDTVGAGDSFMAGLLSGLLDAGLLGGPEAREHLRRAPLADVRPALARALTTSALTVGHAGPYAPTRAEL
ncbi:MAG TPA: carbohydrate kinase [Dermatophilaceae bacterium]|nr:carbohydrate kinase [Dermatophilaceae bacterium]